MTSHSCLGAIVRAVVVNMRVVVVSKGFRGDKVRRKDMCLFRSVEDVDVDVELWEILNPG